MNQCGCVTMPFLDSHHRDGIVGQQLLKIFVAIDIDAVGVNTKYTLAYPH